MQKSNPTAPIRTSLSTSSLGGYNTFTAFNRRGYTAVPTNVEGANRDALQGQDGERIVDTAELPPIPEHLLASDEEHELSTIVIHGGSPSSVNLSPQKVADNSLQPDLSPEVEADDLDGVALWDLLDDPSMKAVVSPSTTTDVVGAVSEAKQLKATAVTIGKMVNIALEPLQKQTLVQRDGYTQSRFNKFLEDNHAIFSPSASAGHQLADVNDCAGVLIVRVRSGEFTIAERVTVVKDNSSPDGEVRYLVKGFGDAIVPFPMFEQMVRELWVGGGEPTTRDPKKVLETEFRTRMRGLSENAELQLRQTLVESDTPAVARPLRLNVNPRIETWENYEDAMPKGFGRVADTEGTKGATQDYQFHYDWNSIEKSISLFANDNYQSGKARTKDGDRYPTRKAGGAALAKIEGVAHVEIIGSRKEVGVKMKWTPGVFIDNAVNNPDDDVVLRITTQDKAIHELRFTPTGAKMTLINPQPRIGCGDSGKAFTANEKLGVDVDVYSYNGVDTGLHTSSSGYADPQLVTSCRDKIPAGPFLIPATGKVKAALNVVSTAAHLVTLQPLRGWVKSSSTASLVAKGVQLGVQGGIVYAMTAVVNMARTGPYNTITGARKAFSASAAGALAAEFQAQLLVSTVLVQEALTAALNQVAQRVPEGLKPEKKHWKFLGGFVGGAVAEFTRLLTNLGIQWGLGVDRGSKSDLAWLGAQASATGLTDSLIVTTGGHAENHRYLQVLQDTLRLCFDLTFRSLGAQKLYANPSEFIKNVREAFTTRLGTRGMDKFLSGMFAHILDANGIIGEHASAYDHQISYAARFDNAVNQLAAFVDQLGVEAGKAEEHAAEWWEAREIVMTLKETLESIKPSLNLITLRSDETPQEQKKDPDYQQASNTAATLNRIHEAELKGNEQEAADERADLLTKHGGDFFKAINRARQKAGDRVQFDTHSLSEDLRKSVLNIRRSRSISVDASSGVEKPSSEKDSDSTTKSVYPTMVTYDGRVFPADTEPGYAQPIPRNLTTFSEKAQGLAKKIHKEMLEDRGLKSMKDSGKLGKRLVNRIVKAIRAYTVESQLFHYPLRYAFTGQKHVVEVVPGVNYAYNVMQGKEGMVDPINALYVNLGMYHAQKFPSVSYRAVVTDVPYLPARPKQADEKSKATVVTEGDEVVMTEILSCTGSRRLAASFGNALGFGAAATERSQLLVVKQESGVNITHVTDLVQAELIFTPGCVFRVVYIDRTGGVDDPKKGESLGQVVYLEQVDTYQWEMEAVEAVEKADIGVPARPVDNSEGAAAIDPALSDDGRNTKIDFGDEDDGRNTKIDFGDEDDATSLILSSPRQQQTAALQGSRESKEASILESKSKAKEASKPASRKGSAPEEEYRPDENPAPPRVHMTPSGHLFDNTAQAKHVSPKSYFVGYELEQADGNKPRNRVARWLSPFTSDTAPRATKDAIHAAILSNDPIVEHLDDAIKNPHHEYFRKKGGYYGTKAHKAEVEARDAIRGIANEIMEPVKQLEPGSDVGAATQEWMAWLLVSMLRQPVALAEVEIDNNGVATLKHPVVDEPPAPSKDPKFAPVPANIKSPQATLFAETYDMVDASLKIDKSPNPTVLIGVGKDGFYAVESRDGQRVCRLIGEGGSTAENFLHAYYRSSGQSSRPDAYEWKDNAYMPDAAAQATVQALLSKMKAFASTDYVVLQTAIVDTFKQRNPDIDFDRLIVDHKRAQIDDDVPPEPWTELACDLADADRVAREILTIDTVAASPVLAPAAPRGGHGGEALDNDNDERFLTSREDDGLEMIPMRIPATSGEGEVKRPPDVDPERAAKWAANAARMVAEQFRDMAQGTTYSDAMLASVGMTRVHNNGSGLNCLIIALLQHVTGDYSSSHNGMARVIRQELLSAHPAAGGLLDADGPTMDTLLHIIEQRFGKTLAVDVYNPNDATGLTPMTIAPPGAAIRVAVILGAHGSAHYEAIRHK